MQGDNNAAWSGWAAWLPLIAPATTDNFYGVNRSPDTRLYGTYYNGASQTIEEALIDASKLIEREGGLVLAGGIAVASIVLEYAPGSDDVPLVSSAHPSPMSADRGFFGSRPFSQANELLEELGADPIDWALP